MRIHDIGVRESRDALLPPVEESTVLLIEGFAVLVPFLLLLIVVDALIVIADVLAIVPAESLLTSGQHLLIPIDPYCPY